MAKKKKLLTCQIRRGGRTKLKKGWTYARGGGCKKSAGKVTKRRRAGVSASVAAAMRASMNNRGTSYEQTAADRVAAAMASSMSRGHSIQFSPAAKRRVKKALHGLFGARRRRRR
jgi:uncharacterized protein YoaH (UPF0181 family)